MELQSVEVGKLYGLGWLTKELSLNACWSEVLQGIQRPQTAISEGFGPGTKASRYIPPLPDYHQSTLASRPCCCRAGPSERRWAVRNPANGLIVLEVPQMGRRSRVAGRGSLPSQPSAHRHAWSVYGMPSTTAVYAPRRSLDGYTLDAQPS